MFWGYVSTENCRSKNMQFLENRCFSWEKRWFLMFATCTKKKHAWFFGPTLLPKKLHEDFRKTQFFGLKHDAKQRRHPKSIKNTPGGAPQGFLFGHKSIFNPFWVPRSGPQNLPLAHFFAWKLQKSEKSISSRGHLGSLRCVFPSKNTFCFVFRAPQGVQTPLRDVFWPAERCKSGESLR